MKTIYSPKLKSNLTLDEKKKIRHIVHTQEYFKSKESNARLAAIDYLRKMAKHYEIPQAQLERLHLMTSFLDPDDQGIEYRLYEMKKFFASTTFCYYQTIHNIPVWQGGMTVTVKENPLRITQSDNYGHYDLQVKLPSFDILRQARTTLIQINSKSVSGNKDLTRTEAEEEPIKIPLKAVLDAPWTLEGKNDQNFSDEMKQWIDQASTTHGVFYIYRYNAEDRVPKKVINFMKREKKFISTETEDIELTLPLPLVPRRITNGQHYLVAEIIFYLKTKPRLYWRALVEVESGSVLWLRAMTSGVKGLVFTYDPKTSTGVLTNTPNSNNAVLNPLRDDVVLLNLDAPLTGVQSLSGTHVKLSDDDSPTVAPPSNVADINGNVADFDYDARTNNFAAVNAYYHANNVFDVIEDLGFTLSGTGGYFNGTSFPVHLDHRASIDTTNGIEVNAACYGNSAGNGIGLVAYCLSDDTGVADTTTNPLGRSVDKWVHWHEIGGHGILWDHVNSPNFGFAHSAGDSLAAFQNDPESHLRTLPERFKYAPFRDWPTGADRWFNRAVASSWGWGGSHDTGGYQSEQVLASTLFRIYQALGGDATEIAKRWHASRVATYLVLNAVGHCSAGDNPSSPEAFYNKLVLADDDDWTSEGLAGNAYNKVIRWAFEKQGLWRAATDPNTAIGAPPPVDLYIDDGRGGEYQYQAVHWNNYSIWNRTAADGGTSHEPGVAGVPSFAYVKIKNRGTTNASGILKVYHCKPGAGLTWPTDFDQATPLAGLPTGNVLANNGNEVIVGPFEWTPNVNTYGHDCLLAIVTAEGDPSNIDKLEPGQTIQEWRLVPHDNNIGQRNVVLVSEAEGGKEWFANLKGAVFFAGNNFNKTAKMKLKVTMPMIMVKNGWSIQFEGLKTTSFQLGAGEKRILKLKVVKGKKFILNDFLKKTSKNIHIYLYGNGMVLGGMTYHIDS